MGLSNNRKEVLPSSVRGEPFRWNQVVRAHKNFGRKVSYFILKWSVQFLNSEILIAEEVHFDVIHNYFSSKWLSNDDDHDFIDTSACCINLLSINSVRDFNCTITPWICMHRRHFGILGMLSFFAAEDLSHNPDQRIGNRIGGVSSFQFTAISAIIFWIGTENVDGYTILSFVGVSDSYQGHVPKNTLMVMRSIQFS